MARIGATFGSLKSPGYRLYFTGQIISGAGEWAQRIGQAWLILELSGSATLLGVTAGLQHLPTLLFGPWGGLLADRLDKRLVLLWSQALSGLLALFLAVLTATGLVRVWMVLVLALALGSVKALDKPVKDSFVYALVGPSRLVNAVMLNSIVFNTAKAIGPAIAGFLIVKLGLASSFFVNAASYMVVIIVLWLITDDQRAVQTRAPTRSRQLREGVAYVGNEPAILGPLLLMTVAGLFAYEWSVTLPLLARDAFNGDAQLFGLFFTCMGLGAIVGGLLVAGSLRPTDVTTVISALVFSALTIAVSLAPNLHLAYALLFVLGSASTVFRASATALLQLRAAPAMRGRVMGLLSVALTGTTPLGGPFIGWLSENLGIRVAFSFGGVVTLLAAVAYALYSSSSNTATTPHFPGGT